MAEILGIVSGGLGIVSLAIQVADSVTKLKSLWDAVKDAPEDVKYLIEEIDTLRLVISEIEHSSSEWFPTSTECAALKKCLDLCRKVAEILSSVVREAEIGIAEKRMRRLKVILKRGVIEKLKDRLRTAQFMLILSNQTYLEALNKRRYELQRHQAGLHEKELGAVRLLLSDTMMRESMTRKELSDMDRPLKVPEDPRNQFPYVSIGTDCSFQPPKTTSRLRKQLIAQLLTPSWLCFSSKVWELRCYKVNCGWMFMAQTHRLVPPNSPIMQFASIGDVRGIQRLFSEKLASPHDRDTYGQTVLDVAAFSHQVEVCQLLLREGSDPNLSAYSSAQLSRRRIEVGLSKVILVKPITHLSWSGVCRKALTTRNYGHQLGNPEVFKWLLNRSTINHRLRTPQERFEIATTIASSSLSPNKAPIIHIALGENEKVWQICTMKDKDGQTLLHRAARFLGEHHTTSIVRQQKEKTKHSHGTGQQIDCFEFFGSLWDHHALFEDRLLVRDLVLGRSSLHELDNTRQTPLLHICGAMADTWAFWGFYYGFCFRNWNWKNISILKPEVIIQIWLQEIADAGVDLVEYGRYESWLHLNGHVFKQWCFGSEFDETSKRKEMLFSVRLVSLTYGPLATDWRFWFTEVMNYSFVEFWHMVDHPELSIPGAWTE